MKFYDSLNNRYQNKIMFIPWQISWNSFTIAKVMWKFLGLICVCSRNPDMSSQMDKWRKINSLSSILQNQGLRVTLKITNFIHRLGGSLPLIILLRFLDLKLTYHLFFFQGKFCYYPCFLLLKISYFFFVC